MSIARDFERYYSGTYVKVTVRGDTLPFYVEGVSYDGPEGDAQYLAENLVHLRFHGILRARDGDTVNTRYPYNEVDLDNPEVGYVVAGNGTPIWLAYVTSRSMLKGLSRDRLNNRRIFGAGIVQQIFDREKAAEKLCDIHFFQHEGTILYKGMPIGSLNEGVVTLNPQYQYLAADASRIFAAKV